MRDYAAATLNPAEAQPCCLPSPPILPSGKLKVWAKGTMALGTLGVGYVMVRPSLANDTGGIFHSTSLFEGDETATAGTGVSAANNNSPYTTSNFSATAVQCRHVATGLRVRYTGTLLNRGGRAVAAESPSHNSLNGYSQGDLLAIPEVRSVPIGQDWINEVWNVRLPGEYSFVTSPYPTAITNPSLAIIVSGEPGNTFEFEVYTLGEVVGNLVTNATPSHGDSSLYSRLIDITGQLSTSALDRYASLPWDKLSRVALNYVLKASQEGGVYRRVSNRIEL
jgi:hypothetical protein